MVSGADVRRPAFTVSIIDDDASFYIIAVNIEHDTPALIFC